MLYADRHKTLLITSEHINGTANTSWSAVEDIDINHRRLDVAMAQEFLDRSYIVTAFEQVSCERMPESMARGPLRQPCSWDCIPHGLLNQGFINVMSSHSPVFVFFLRKDPLPTPVGRGIRVLAAKRIGQQNAAPAVGKVFIVRDYSTLQSC